MFLRHRSITRRTRETQGGGGAAGQDYAGVRMQEARRDAEGASTDVVGKTIVRNASPTIGSRQYLWVRHRLRLVVALGRQARAVLVGLTLARWQHDRRRSRRSSG